MKYQLVIQIKEQFFSDEYFFEKLEAELEQSLTKAEIDGHDVGKGELNFFIHTDYPDDTLEEVKLALDEAGVEPEVVKVGYRDFYSDTYIPMWPKDLKEFKVT